MELCLILLAPILAGSLLAAGLHRLADLLPFGRYRWPLCFFFAALGAAANNTSAVLFAGGDAFLPGGGGFFGGDNLTALFTGLLAALFAVSGLVTCLLLRQKPDGRPGALAAWTWSWVLTQGALACVILLLGSFVTFRTFPGDGAGLPLWGYLLLVSLLCLSLGACFGRHWGGAGRAALPLAGMAAVCAGMLLLAAGMLAQAQIDPSWGLDLIQSPAGMWYARLNLPAALLLGDYQYAWEIRPPGLWLSAAAPHALFTVGYLVPRIYRRGF